MRSSVLLLVLIALAAGAFALGRGRAIATVGGQTVRLHSVPVYYGLYSAAWASLPAFGVFVLWLAAADWLATRIVLQELPSALTGGDAQSLDMLRAVIRNLVAGIDTGVAPDPAILGAAHRYVALRGLGNWAVLLVCVGLAVSGVIHALARIVPQLRARVYVERVLIVFLVLCSLVAILTTLGIVLSLLFEALAFFSTVFPFDFLFGLHWSPQIAIRADQIGSSGAFGALPLFAGTLLITVIAMIVAVPVGLMAAIYLSEYADRRVRDVLKPILEILAGIPTVVYGFFAALTMAPFVRWAGTAVGLDVSSESALAAGLVMGVMIIPFVSSLSDDVINAVPQALRDGSLGLGATKSETIRQVVLPAALPGIVAAIMLAVSRAIGETMIVAMAAGMTANLTANPLASVTTVTAQIATLLVGDQEFDSPKTLAAFGLGLVLFLVTLALNIVALKVVKKYREKYD